MSLDCISCAWPISNEYPCLARYQALYLTPDGAQLSDVSVTEFDWSDEMWYNRRRNVKTFGPWFVMSQSKPAKAVFVHEHCWPLLTKHFANEEVNLDTLFEVCRDIPLGPNSMFHNDKTGAEYHQGPWYLKRPVIRGIADATKALSKVQGRPTSASSNVSIGADCFSLLAMEIRLEIADYLSTVDFLRLRSASRAMAPVFELQSFWKTRFRINSDRGFLSCLADGPLDRKRKNWRAKYRSTARIDQPYLHLWALRRQWRQNRWLEQRCSMVRGFQTNFQINLLGEFAWKGASAEIRCDRHPGQGKGCSKCGKEHILITQGVALQNLAGLAVSILDEGTKTYITGFDLISADVETPNITFGYRLPGRQVTINLHGQQLRGFTIITGDGGIHAIRPILNTNIVASWIGQPEENDACNSTQLSLEDDVKAMLGNFDQCKMVSLSIA